jgi:hypothetical protein
MTQPRIRYEPGDDGIAVLSEDAREGPSAHLEKRKPAFRGR